MCKNLHKQRENSCSNAEHIRSCKMCKKDLAHQESTEKIDVAILNISEHSKCEKFELALADKIDLKIKNTPGLAKM
jgi:hypothetical protein